VGQKKLFSTKVFVGIVWVLWGKSHYQKLN
jgi:hypothetical protein